MNNTLTQEDIKNIIALIGVAPIKGFEAMTVALLQQKLSKLVAAPLVETEVIPPTQDEIPTNEDNKPETVQPAN